MPGSTSWICRATPSTGYRTLRQSPRPHWSRSHDPTCRIGYVVPQAGLTNSEPVTGTSLSTPDKWGSAHATLLQPVMPILVRVRARPPVLQVGGPRQHVLDMSCRTVYRNLRQSPRLHWSRSDDPTCRIGYVVPQAGLTNSEPVTGTSLSTPDKWGSAHATLLQPVMPILVRVRARPPVLQVGGPRQHVLDMSCRTVYRTLRLAPRLHWSRSDDPTCRIGYVVPQAGLTSSEPVTGTSLSTPDKGRSSACYV